MPPTPAPGPLPSAFSPGSRFGSYEIIQQLGAGGMGELYRARDTRLGREVALKTISLHAALRSDALARFEQEARSASALNHPNIVTIYELGEADGARYIAMELIQGETLREALASGPLPFRKTVAIAAQIADALANAHAAGIVHRDLKPENLMVCADGRAKILDFGLAKLHSPEATLSGFTSTAQTQMTEPGTLMGTVGYMSPEQASGGCVDFRSDQFSFGAVLYEMITRTPAFSGATQPEILAAILRDQPERLASRALQAPAPFIWILERCLAKTPDQRYASSTDLARDLAAIRDRMTYAQPTPAKSPTRNLPVQRTAFIGRERETAELQRLLCRPDVRLVTLTGPGGIGKTRLALHAVSGVAGQFPSGVQFVGLSAVREARLISTAIAQALGICDSGGQSSQQPLEEYLGALDAPMLLLLDNFEHLVAAGPAIADLLSVAPQLKVLVTSQAPLHVYGEHESPIPPLAIPNPDSLPNLDVLSRLPSVALFVERAQAVKQDFALTKDNAAAVAAICSRLDGLPLAIELAAARVKLLSPSAMLARLQKCLNLLTGGARDLPARQQTLRATVDWSYGLLNPAEQTLFRRLSVFSGGCTLEGVEAVCDTAGDLSIDILDGMASMVDKSLVQQVGHTEGEARFAMLSTVREYALERLTESGDEHATRRAHAAYCLVLAEEGSGNLDSQSEWLDRLETEHGNFRSALDFLVTTGDADWGLRLGAALFRFWETRDHLTEGRDRIAALLALPGTRQRPKLRARLLFAAAVLAGEQGDYASAQTLMEESLETCRALNDDHGVAVALNALGLYARDRGDLVAASSTFEQALAIWKQLGYPADIARCLSNLANVTKLRREYARALSAYDECLAMFRKAGDEDGVAWTINYQGDVAREQGDFVSARAHYEQSLARFSDLRDGWGVASTLCDLANLTRDQGDFAAAQRLYCDSVKTFQALGHKRGVARVLENLAASAAGQSHPEYSLRLAGAAAALRKRLGAPLTPAEHARVDNALEPARRALTHAEGLTAWMEGWAMPIEEAVDAAIHGCSREPSASRTSE